MHKRFDYFKQEGRMRNKVKDKRYDLTNSNEPETEDEAWTTDFEADDLSL